MNTNKFLTALDRLTTWILWWLFLVMMISGYMITRGFLSRFWGGWLHTYLDIPIMIFFSLHVGIRLKFLLIRKMRDSLLLNLLCFLFGAIPLLFMIFLDEFYW